jgi:hypothetical protein
MFNWRRYLLLRSQEGHREDMVEFLYRPAVAYGRFVSRSVSATAIGWLGTQVPSRGNLTEVEREALTHFHRFHEVDEGLLGHHACGLCLFTRYRDRGELMVCAGERTYVLPKMVLHYIDAHGYRPAEQFMADLVSLWRSERSKDCRTGRCNRATKPGPTDSAPGRPCADGTAGAPR